VPSPITGPSSSVIGPTSSSGTSSSNIPDKPKDTFFKRSF
jgi:hypothetical protein